MSGQLSWTREGETLALHGSWIRICWSRSGRRARATAGTAIIDLSQTTRVDTAGALLFCGADSPSGPEAQLVGKSENLQTLIGLYNLPADLIS